MQVGKVPWLLSSCLGQGGVALQHRLAQGASRPLPAPALPLLPHRTLCLAPCLVQPVLQQHQAHLEVVEADGSPNAQAAAHMHPATIYCARPCLHEIG